MLSADFQRTDGKRYPRYRVELRAGDRGRRSGSEGTDVGFTIGAVSIFEAVLITIAAVGLRLALNPLLGDDVPYMCSTSSFATQATKAASSPAPRSR